MWSNPEERIAEIVAILDEQRAKIQRLHKEYHSGYDAVFDDHGAVASAERWCDRTLRVIRERVSDSEAVKFQRAVAKAPRIRRSWDWNELCQYLDTYLIRLIEDMEQNPDDPSFAKRTDDPANKLPAAIGATPGFDVFLSYSSLDKDEAREICEALGKKNKKCFLAEKSLQPGDKFADKIRDAIKRANEIWILVSPNSVRSDWVQREVAAAWALEKKVVPVLLRCAPRDLPEALADAHAIDFHAIGKHIKGMN